ncbi:VirK/YbjX family protein [Photobacterium alginatilyticum]|uniref:VirK/YbjX family protein n=1 Tax=Photobacterium alginatilyticum TaxID=1775171 RepID=UPI0040684217
MHNFHQLVSLSNTVHPGTRGINYVRKNLRFVMWGMLSTNIVKQVKELAVRSNLSPIIQHDPKIFEKPLKPFVSTKFRAKDRAHLLRTHFEILEQRFGCNTPRLYLDAIELLHFEDRDGNPYCIEFYPGESREGSLGLRLVESQTDYTLYSVTVNFSQQNTKRTMHIGCLQGASHLVEDSQGKIKALTRTLHGLRPKALMLELALMLANYMNMNEVQAISNKGHIYQALRYIGSKKGAIVFDYDTLWQEFGGTKINKHFYAIPLLPERKEPSTLKKAKRRLYTKRYQWLDQTRKKIETLLNTLTQSSV